MQFLIDKRFKNRIKMRYEKYDIQAGILKDGPHYPAQPLTRTSKRGKVSKVKRPHTQIDGMKARRKIRSRKMSGPLKSIAHVARDLRRKTGVNFFRRPFRGKLSIEARRFKKALMKMFGAKKMGNKRKLAEQLLVEAIRKPIRRRAYGPNRADTVLTKGFNRRLFDTGQVYEAIRARIKRKPKGGANV